MAAKEVILITGPAGNLGKAVVKRFQREERSFILLDHHPDRLKNLYPELSNSSSHLLIGGVNLVEAQAVRESVARGIDRFGRIDCLIHTVGGFTMESYLSEDSEQTLDRMLDLNLKTLFQITHAVLPYMVEQGKGKIITVGARPALQGKAHMSAYSAAKAAVLRLTESLSAEFKNKGIQINCLIPGTIDTPENRQAMPESDFSRWVSPESLADVIHFLCSSAADDIQGAAVPVYGA